MHGTLRLILASLVVLSHLGVSFYGYNMGVSAVVVFYLLAGMVSYKLISTIYINKPHLYYIDRIKRIFPLYLIVLLFSYIVYKLGGSSYFISAEPNFITYLSNMIIIPLSYYMYNHIDKFTLLPPAWSLGVELQFYILAPFILMYIKRLLILLFLSFIIYILAIIGVINTDYFGYRLIVGVFFIFLIGVLIQKSINIENQPYFNPLILIYFLILLVFIYVYTIGYKAPYNYETLFALLVGIPLLLKLPRKVFLLDKYLGSLSYGIFLVHFPVLWLLEIYEYSLKDINLIFFITFILSVIFIYLEKLLRNFFFKK
jgi:peptidoglycan/LPS O-acetylase OafA/YrhL